MTNALATTTTTTEVFKIMEQVVGGNLAGMTPADRVSYAVQVCNSLGLNPATSPFKFIEVKGQKGAQIILYATKDATEQLRKRDNVSVEIVARETVGECYVVTARATIPGTPPRIDESIGAVSIKGQAGDFLCNSIMKAETKAKRRVTLSICGLGFLDESEVETIPGARQIEDQQAPVQHTPAPPQPAQLPPPPAPPQPATILPPAPPSKVGKPVITNDQIGEIAYLKNELKMSEHDYVERLSKAFAKTQTNTLTADEADKVIRGLRARMTVAAATGV